MWSLERRLRRYVLLAVSLLWLVGAGLSLYWQWQEMAEVLDAAQEEMAINLLRLPAMDASVEVFKALPKPQTAHDQTVLSQVFTTDGKLLWRSLEAPETPLARIDTSGFVNTSQWRIVVRAAPALNRVSIVATSLQDSYEALIDGAQALFVPLLILLPLTAWGLTWLLRRAFVQTDSLRQTLRERNEQDLGPLPTSGLPAEIVPLVDEINLQFSQLKQARDAERSFAANSAHELRTPIAAALAQLRRLAHDVDDLPGLDAERQMVLTQRMTSVDRQLNKLQRLCVKLLQLSRAQSGVACTAAPVNLLQLAQFVLEEFSVQVHQGRLTIIAPQAADGRAREVQALGDMDALGIALRNLIENGLEHGGPGAKVQVRVTDHPAIEVIDDGPGLNGADIDQLMEPFQRGATAASGHGIGLAIVRSIAAQMQGVLEFESPCAHGRGMLVRIKLRPAMAPASEGRYRRVA
jgi:two-component system OmpR family sensor kinase